MPGVLRPENLHRRLALGQRGREIGRRRAEIGGKMPRANLRAEPDTGIDDDAIQRSEFFTKRVKDFENLVVIADIQCPQADADLGLLGRQLGPQALQRIGVARTKRQMTPPRGKLACHAGAQPSARAGDQNCFSHPCSLVMNHLVLGRR